MSGSLQSRLARRARQALGVEHLSRRLDDLEVQLQQVYGRQGDRWPNPPVYLGDHTALVVARWGGKLVVDTRDALLSPWLLADGLWESHITGWFERHVRPGQVVVDVGANIGYFTVLSGRLVGPAGQVVAVEAHPRIAELLRRNVVINGQHGWTTVWERAAWSRAERLTFHQRVHYAANSSLGRVDGEQLATLGDIEASVEVEAIALDELLGELPRVDVMKIDVEGAEIQALHGLERTLGSNPGLTVLLEWAPEQLRAMGTEPAELLALLQGHGFGFRLFEAGLERVEPSRVAGIPYGNLLLER